MPRDYKPNVAARTLVTGQPRMIGVLDAGAERAQATLADSFVRGTDRRLCPKTVSRVLNDGNDVAAATRERMLQSTEIPSAT